MNITIVMCIHILKNRCKVLLTLLKYTIDGLNDTNTNYKQFQITKLSIFIRFYKLHGVGIRVI